MKKLIIILTLVLILDLAKAEWCITAPNIPFPKMTGIGTYSTTAITSDRAQCGNECYNLGMTYSAVWKNNYCFCLNDISGTTNITDISTCSNLDGLFINTVAKTDMILYNHINFTEVVYTNAITFTPYIILLDPKDSKIGFQYSYQDRNNIWEYSSSLTPLERSIYGPGIYEVRVQGVKQDTLAKLTETSGQFLFYEKISNVNLTCQPLGIMYILANCFLTINAGSIVSGKVNIDGVFSENVSLPDIPWERLGLVPNFFKGTFLSGLSKAGINIINTVFQFPGTVSYIEIYGAQTQSIDILLLKPSCTSYYCLSNANCDTNPFCSRQFQCNQPYCPFSSGCSENCNSRNNETMTIEYKIDQTFNYKIVKVGYQIITLSSPWSVNSGYRLAFHSQSVDDVIATTVIRKGEVGTLFSNSHTITVGTSLLPSSISFVNAAHQFSAVSKPIRNIKFKFMFNTTGKRNVMINFRTLDNVDVPASSSILIGLDINDTSLSSSPVTVTNTSYTFVMNPHTGDMLSYFWNFGDGTTSNSTVRNQSHIYTKSGTYNVSITVFNSLTSKIQYFILNVKEIVKILSVNGMVSANANTPISFTVIMMSGSGFNCTLSGDGLTNITQSSSNLYFTVQWATDGTYNVTMSCYNEYSNDSKSWTQNIVANLSGLAFTKLGGPAFEMTQLGFSWLSGKNVFFQLMIDNVSRLVTKNEVTRTGFSETFNITKLGNVVGVLRANNSLTDLILVANLTFSERIRGFQIKPDSINIKNGSAVKVSITMTTGSGVTVISDYSDGTNDTNTSSITSRWDNSYFVQHIFKDIGNYNISVNCTNIVNTELSWVMVYVLSSLGTYQVMTNSQFLKKSENLALSMKRTSGNIATMANITIDWNDGQKTVVPHTQFNESAIYNHQFTDLGTYNVTIIMQNPINMVNNFVIIKVINAISDLKCDNVPQNIETGKSMMFLISAGGSDSTIVSLDPGDGGSVPNKTAKEFNFTYTYNNANNYTWTGKACNEIGCLNCSKFIQVQNKINNADFQVITNGNVQYLTDNSVTTISFNGAKFPTGLTAILTSTDGSPPVVITLTQNMMPYTLPKNITTTGYGKISVTLQNLVSSANYSAEYGVFEKFFNFKVDVSWGPSRSPGFGPNQNTFPLNQPTYFRPSITSKGTVTGYTFTYIPVKNISAKYSYNVTATNGEISHTFTVPDTYNLSLKAFNPIDSANSDLSIIIGDTLSNTEISTLPIPLLPDRPGTVVLKWNMISPDSCICVDLGNGTKIIYGATSGCTNCTGYSYANIKPQNNGLNIFVKYSTGDYLIKVLVYNSFGSVSANKTIPVTSIKCGLPVLSMTYPKYMNPITPQQEQRSSQILLSAIVQDLPCIVTKSNIKAWTAILIDNSTLRPIKPINLGSIETNNNTQLIIPPLFLECGLYLFSFKVTMDKNVTINTFESTTQIYLLIDKTPIVVSLSSGGLSLISVGINQNICFNPKIYSQDPDLNTQTFTNWTWIWTCSKIDETPNLNVRVYPKPRGYTFTGPKTGCFGDGPGIINFTDNVYCFTGNNLDVNVTYRVTLQVSTPDNRNGSAKLNLLAVPSIPPNISIECLRKLMCKINKEGDYAYNEMIVNPSDALLINSSCMIPPDTPCPKGIWSLLLLKDNSTSWISPDQSYLSPLVNDSVGEQSKISSFNSTQLSLFPSFFEKFSEYERFQICYNSKDLTPDGKACIQFKIFPLPNGISCSLNGSTIQQNDIVCSNCTKKSKLQYRVYVNTSGHLTTLGFSDNGYFCSLIPYQETVQSYFVRISNENGGFIDINAGNITVKQLNQTEMSNIISGLYNGSDNSLELAIAKGDYKEMSEEYLKYISVITASNKNLLERLFPPYTNNTKSNLGGTGYGMKNVSSETITIENLSPDKKAIYEKDRDKKSEIINTMTAGLYNMVPGDVKSLHLVSSVVSSIASSYDSINRASQWQMSVKLNNLAKNLKDLQKDAPRSDINIIATNILTATVENDAAANVQIGQGILRDIKQSKDKYLDYDTNLESSKNSYVEISDIDLASTSLIKETNAGFQSKIAFGVGSNSEKTITEVTKIMRDVTVINDIPINVKSPYIEYYAMKTEASKLSNKNFSKGRSEVVLPDICKTTNISSQNCSDPNNPIGIEIIATPNNVRSYLPNENGDGSPIPLESDFVTLNLFTGNQQTETPLQTNGNGNFTIFIGRDATYKIPDFNFSEPDPKIEEPKLIPGAGTIFSPLYFEQKLVVYQFKLTGINQSVHFQITSNFSKTCTQYLVVGRLGSPPVMSIPPDGIPDSVNFSVWGMIPNHTKYCQITASPEDPDPFTFFVDNFIFNKLKVEVQKSLPDYSKTLDTLYFGVRELTPPEWNKYNSDNRPPVPYPISAKINNTFRVRIYSSSCYSNSDNFKSGWNTSGCLVGPLTTPVRTQCICNHLTSFAAGWIVAPNTIDFNYVFSNFDFTRNLTLFVTEIVIFLVFILIFIWARRQDNRDIEKLGVSPLPSNDSNDTYLYEITVDTSIRANAGTKSNVYFVLSGELDETDARHLQDSKRPILKRGNEDRFLLAVPRPLGTLQYIRLWHDNSGKGKEASWYCNHFGVTDLQTKEKFHFLVNNWFAVEEDDGQIDRLIAVASVTELMHFEEVFARKMKLNLSEDHLWLSIMARPPESRFTRVERVACCLLLLFLTMLTTCMFYQKEGPTKTASPIFTIGPFALTPKEIWTGLISNMIAFVPLFIIIELFRKSQLKHGHANKLRQAVENHFLGDDEPPQNKGLQSSMATLIRNDEMDTSRPNTPGFRSMDQINIQVPYYDAESPRNPGENEGKRIIRKKLFPWWTRIISWVFLIILLIVGVFFTTLYGIQFGDLACKKWISSMFISFFTSVLLTQPIKVILLAMFVSLVCKKTTSIGSVEFVDEEEELMNELGKRNELMHNEEYLHNDLYNTPIRPYRLVVQPPPKEELEKAREMRLKELQMFDVFREIVFYLIFFCTLVFVTYSFRDPHSFMLKNELTRIFITPPNQNLQFTGITRDDQFWAWALNILVPGLRAPVWYNNAPQLYQRGFIGDRNNRLIGYAILRQVRAKKGSCKIQPSVKNLVSKCYSATNIINEEKENYSVKWKRINENRTASPEFTYRSEKSLKGIPYVGRIGLYSGGGYVYEFRSNISNLYYEINKLKDNNWIDAQTRAIFIEFTTYNPNINLFAINTYVLELPGSGGMWPVYRVEPANLLGLYSGDAKMLEILLQILYAIFILIMIVKEIRNVVKQRGKYFFQFWNLCEIFIIFGSFAVVAGYVYVTLATNVLTEKFQQYAGNVYLNFNLVAFWNENLGYLVSTIIFVSTLKFIKVLRFNRRIGMLGAVLSYSGKDMRQFFIIFTITFLAFVMIFYSLFMDSLYRYHTFLFATEASMQIALGKFAFLELYQKEPIFGPVVFSCYVLFIIFVLLNMFIAILTEGFAVVKADIDLQSNDHELVDYIVTKFVMWTGIDKTKIGQKLIKTGFTDQVYIERDSRKVSDRLDEFPEKVQKLLNHINRMMYDGKKPIGQNDKQFSSMIFDKSKPVVKGADDPFEISRPPSAASNILRNRSNHQMTPIEK